LQENERDEKIYSTLVLDGKSFMDFIYFSCRLENREIYSTSSSSSIARSKSPNIFNRKALDSNTMAVNKTNSGGAQKQQQQQRARTASMPGENRKVKNLILNLK
jgi:hypothetical protein